MQTSNKEFYHILENNPEIIKKHFEMFLRIGTAKYYRRVKKDIEEALIYNNGFYRGSYLHDNDNREDAIIGDIMSFPAEIDFVEDMLKVYIEEELYAFHRGESERDKIYEFIKVISFGELVEKTFSEEVIKEIIADTSSVIKSYKRFEDLIGIPMDNSGGVISQDNGKDVNSDKEDEPPEENDDEKNLRYQDGSRHIQLDIYSDAPEFEKMVNDLYSLLKPKGHKNRAIEHLNIVLCNLYLQVKTFEGKNLTYHRNKNKYFNNESRYNPNHISRDILVKIVDSIYGKDFILHKKGYYNSFTKQGRVSRMKATEDLERLFDSYDLDLSMIRSHPNREPLILKGSKDEKTGYADLEKYDDTEKTIEIREVLNNYNNLLSKSQIGVLEGKEIIKKDGTKPNLYDKFVKRIFNNNNFGLGGRFYCGWWQNVKSSQRDFISIDGKETVELDYSAIHIYIAASLEGDEVGEYPYQINIENIPEINQDIDAKTIKKLAKSATLIALNCNNKEQSYKAIRMEYFSELGYDKTQEIFPNKTKNKIIESIIAEVIKINPFIEKYISSGKGLELQYKDSQIAEYIIKKFTDMGKVVLCYHDGFRVKAEDESLLKQTMLEAYIKIIKGTPPKVEKE